VTGHRKPGDIHTLDCRFENFPLETNYLEVFFQSFDLESQNASTGNLWGNRHENSHATFEIDCHCRPCWPDLDRFAGTGSGANDHGGT
jgi:hypothetical protein